MDIRKEHHCPNLADLSTEKNQDRQQTKMKVTDKMVVYLSSWNLEQTPLPEKQMSAKLVGEAETSW